jgi:hypothetical protein
VYDKLNGRAPEAGDLWLTDHHVCVASWIWELHQRGAAVRVREHQQIPGQPLDSMPPVATTAHGRRSEQSVTCPAPDGMQRLAPSTPTREGETTLSLLRRRPESAANAVQVADLYRERRTLENPVCM